MRRSVHPNVVTSGAADMSFDRAVADGDESGRPSSRRASRFVKGTAVEKPPNNDGDGLMAIALHPLNVLLVCFPLGMCAWLLEWRVEVTFWLNFLAMVPLAKILGDATEELAAAMRNDMLAGLLNATFGNAVEMVMTIIMLYKNKITLVKQTLLGSVLSNLLLVLGMSFFCGGLVQQSKKQRRSGPSDSRIDMEVDKGKPNEPIGDKARPGPSNSPRDGAIAEDRVGLVGQDVGDARGGRSSQKASFADDNALAEETYEFTVDDGAPRSSGVEFAGEVVQTFSAMTALVNTSMLLLSCLSTSLVTVFSHELATRSSEGKSPKDILIPVSRLCSIIIILAYVAYVFFQLVTHRESMGEDDNNAQEDDEDEGATISIGTSVTVMFLVTIIVAFSSEALVASVDGVVEGAHMPENFIGIILMPIVGNACEHASAIRFAIQDKPGLSIGIAVGSSTQISLFVVPFSVLIGWFVGHDMDLDFGALNTTVLFISVVVVLSVVVDGRANWLQGYLLISAYAVIAVLYWHLPGGESGMSEVRSVAEL